MRRGRSPRRGATATVAPTAHHRILFSPRILHLHAFVCIPFGPFLARLESLPSCPASSRLCLSFLIPLLCQRAFHLNPQLSLVSAQHIQPHPTSPLASIHSWRAPWLTAHAQRGIARSPSPCVLSFHHFPRISIAYQLLLHSPRLLTRLFAHPTLNKRGPYFACFLFLTGRHFAVGRRWAPRCLCLWFDL